MSFQLTVSSPLRQQPLDDANISPSWSAATVTAKGWLIYSPRTGRTTGFRPIGQPIPPRVLRDLSRPWGLSQSHWRKIKREARARRAV